jgi:hypothetical protein
MLPVPSVQEKNIMPTRANAREEIRLKILFLFTSTVLRKSLLKRGDIADG